MVGAQGPGRMLGNYQLGAFLGSGPIGDVYRAQPVGTADRELAVKMIRPPLLNAPATRSRFLQIGQAVARFDHPHILPLEFAGELGPQLASVTPLVNEGSLMARFARGRLSPRDIAPLFQQMCDALTYAHTQGIIHANLKPTNVFLFEGRHILLGDFGMLWQVVEVDLTQSGLSAESVAYLAPEQADGIADIRTDIYSLGVMLFQALTGVPPFSGRTPFEVLSRHQRQPVPPLASVNPGLGPAALVYDEVIRMALAKDPNARFQAMPAMARAIFEAEKLATDLPSRLQAAIRPDGQMGALPPPRGAMSQPLRPPTGQPMPGPLPMGGPFPPMGGGFPPMPATGGPFPPMPPGAGPGMPPGGGPFPAMPPTGGPPPYGMAPGMYPGGPMRPGPMPQPTPESQPLFGGPNGAMPPGSPDLPMQPGFPPLPVPSGALPWQAQAMPSSPGPLPPGAQQSIESATIRQPTSGTPSREDAFPPAAPTREEEAQRRGGDRSGQFASDDYAQSDLSTADGGRGYDDGYTSSRRYAAASGETDYTDEVSAGTGRDRRYYRYDDDSRYQPARARNRDDQASERYPAARDEDSQRYSASRRGSRYKEDDAPQTGQSRAPSPSSRLPAILGMLAAAFFLVDLLMVAILMPQRCPGHICDGLNAQLTKAINRSNTTPNTLSIQSSGGAAALTIYAGGTLTLDNRLTVTNTGSQPQQWSVKSNLPWVVATPGGGTLAAGGAALLTLTIAPDTTIVPATYQVEITVLAGSQGTKLTLPVVVNTPPHLKLDAATVAIPQCGQSKAITLTNDGGWQVKNLAITPSESSVLQIKLDPAATTSIDPGAAVKMTITLGCGATPTTNYAVYIVSSAGSFSLPVTLG